MFRSKSYGVRMRGPSLTRAKSSRNSHIGTRFRFSQKLTDRRSTASQGLLVDQAKFYKGELGAVAYVPFLATRFAFGQLGSIFDFEAFEAGTGGV